MQKGDYIIQVVVLTSNENSTLHLASHKHLNGVNFTCRIIEKSKLSAKEMIKLRKFMNR